MPRITATSEQSRSAGEPVAAQVAPAVESAGEPPSLGGRGRRSDEVGCLAGVPHSCMGQRERRCVTGSRGERRCRHLVPRGSESCICPDMQRACRSRPPARLLRRLGLSRAAPGLEVWGSNPCVERVAALPILCCSLRTDTSRDCRFLSDSPDGIEPRVTPALHALVWLRRWQGVRSPAGRFVDSLLPRLLRGDGGPRPLKAVWSRPVSASPTPSPADMDHGDAFGSLSPVEAPDEQPLTTHRHTLGRSGPAWRSVRC
jgi:hypothetical protein